MKATILKAWPEMEGFAPLLTSPSEASKPTPFLKIDFSYCHTVDSCGLTAFLLKIMQYDNKFEKNEAKWTLTGLDRNMSLQEDIIKLRFFEPIMGKNIEENIKDKLFEDNFVSSNEGSVDSEIFGAYRYSFPIVFIKFDNNDRRTTGINLIKPILFERLNAYIKKYTINIMQWITILIELVKNTADHADADAIFGMDIYETNNSLKINFLYGDFGIGIMEQIKMFLRENNDLRHERLDLEGAYYIACEKGFSSKPNSGRNLGRGMSTIIEFSKTLNMRLSVFDASSRVLLSEFDVNSLTNRNSILNSYSHKQLRRKFFVFSRVNPFCYYGTVEARKK
jgi:hypothetical protein